MNRLFFITFLIGLMASGTMYAQKKIVIGETEYILQSPIKIGSSRNDSLRGKDITFYRYGDSKYGNKKGYERFIKELYFGIGFMCPVGGNDNMPVYYGNSFNLEVGSKLIYRPVKWYGIGTIFQYSAYSYKLKHGGKDVFDLGIATTDGTHYYRTDNLGTGIVNRFYLFPGRKYYSSDQVFIELIAWGDYSYSKRLKIKDFSSGKKKKYKYRDGSKFNPFQAGVQCGIGYKRVYVYGKYRLTNAFNSNISVKEVPRFSIGIQFMLGVYKL